MNHEDDETLPLVYNPNNNKIDDIVNRIGFGRYQILLGLGFSLKFFVDGSIVAMMTIMSFAVEEDWDLSSFELSALIGSLLIGTSLGFLSSPIFETSFGRIKTIYISLFLLMIAGVLAAMMDGVWSLSAILLFQGFFMMVSSPACLALAVETSPTQVRGMYVLLILLSLALGQIFIISFSLILTSGLDSDYWRILQITTSAFVIPAILVLYQVGYESPLYLAKNREFNLATIVLNKIAIINKTDAISQNEVDYVYSVLPFYSKNLSSKMSVLFNRWHIGLTIKTILLSSMSTVAYFGVNAVLPVVLDLDEEEDTDMLWGLFFIYLCQVPFILAFVYLVEVSIFGRKISLVLTSSLICVSMVVIALVDDYDVTYALMLVSVGITFVNAAIADLYISEVFETEIRILALGIANVCSIFLCSALILFFFYMNDSNDILFFVLLAFIFGVMIVVGYILPYDTAMTVLDSRI